MRELRVGYRRKVTEELNFEKKKSNPFYSHFYTPQLSKYHHHPPPTPASTAKAQQEVVKESEWEEVFREMSECFG